MSNSGIFVTGGTLGVNLDYKGSAPAVLAPLLKVFGSDGHEYVHALAGGALGSTATITIASKGTATALTAGTYITGTTGGVASGQYFWARKGTI